MDHMSFPECYFYLECIILSVEQTAQGIVIGTANVSFGNLEFQSPFVYRAREVCVT
jgi:hypothetical protein